MSESESDQTSEPASATSAFGAELGDAEGAESQHPVSPTDADEGAVEASSSGEESDASKPATNRFAILWFTLARIGLLLLVGILLYLVGARAWLLLLLALIISGLLSYLLLQPLRDAVSIRMAERVDASRARRAAAQAEEDDIY